MNLNKILPKEEIILKIKKESVCVKYNNNYDI